MPRFGLYSSDLSGFADAVVVDPSGSYEGNFFLDVFYVNDKFPGACHAGCRCLDGQPGQVVPRALRRAGIQSGSGLAALFNLAADLGEGKRTDRYFVRSGKRRKRAACH